MEGYKQTEGNSLLTSAITSLTRSNFCLYDTVFGILSIAWKIKCSVGVKEPINKSSCCT